MVKCRCCCNAQDDWWGISGVGNFVGSDSIRIRKERCVIEGGCDAKEVEPRAMTKRIGVRYSHTMHVGIAVTTGRAG